MEAARWIHDYGLWAVPVLMAVSGTGFINQDLLLLVIGWASVKGELPLAQVVAVTYPSLLLCDQILYSVVRSARRVALIRDSWIARAAAPLVARGMLAVFVARFMVASRGPVYMLVGLAGLPRARFLLADALAALLSVPVWIWMGRAYGPGLWDAVRPYALPILLTVLTGLGAWLVWRRWRVQVAAREEAAAAAVPATADRARGE